MFFCRFYKFLFLVQGVMRRHFSRRDVNATSVILVRTSDYLKLNLSKPKGFVPVSAQSDRGTVSFFLRFITRSVNLFFFKISSLDYP
jgi:hypothetical protein